MKEVIEHGFCCEVIIYLQWHPSRAELVRRRGASGSASLPVARSLHHEIVDCDCLSICWQSHQQQAVSSSRRPHPPRNPEHSDCLRLRPRHPLHSCETLNSCRFSGNSTTHYTDFTDQMINNTFFYREMPALDLSSTNFSSLSPCCRKATVICLVEYNLTFRVWCVLQLFW